MTKEERLKAAEAAYPCSEEAPGLHLIEMQRKAFIKGAEAEAESKCDHKLIDVSNKFIDGGYMCVICNMTFKAHVTTP